MDAFPSAADEGRRLAALRQYSLAEDSPAPALVELAQLAAAACQAPMAFIAFVDETRQRMAASVGFERVDAPREASFGRLLLARTDPLIVDNARGDARLALDPLVTGPAHTRLYAGAPLLVPEGHVIGCLAVADRAVRSLTPAQAQSLSALSRQVVTQLEVRRQTEILREGEERLRLALRDRKSVV